MDIILMKIGVKKMNLKINEIMNEDDKPLYFYHLVDKNADMSKGIISLQYMYDNKMDDLFDKNIIKYKDRIINDWNIEKYKGKEKKKQKRGISR